MARPEPAPPLSRAQAAKVKAALSDPQIKAWVVHHVSRSAAPKLVSVAWRSLALGFVLGLVAGIVLALAI